MYWRKIVRLLLAISSTMLVYGCESMISNADQDSSSVNGNDESDANDEPDWLVPINEILDGGPGKDGIAAISEPHFESIIKYHNYQDNDLVIGVKIGNETRAYPHPVLDWHEIVNDQIGDSAFALTYCPLTGSGIAWDRRLDGKTTTFGVSGLLYNTNLIPYDRATGSNWSQMQLRCINGDHLGEAIKIYPVVETTLESWREMYPGSKIMTTETGYNRPYGTYPYTSYRTNSRLIFPVKPLDDRLPLKERVVGVIVGTDAKVYRVSTFPDTIGTINDEFMGLPVVAVGSRTRRLAVVYGRELPDGTVLTFEALQNQLPVVMRDNEGTTWDIFGEAVGGSRSGQQLPRQRSFIAYWFAWGAFYPQAEIYSP